MAQTADGYWELANEFERKVRDEAERLGVTDWFAAGHAARVVATTNPELVRALGEATAALP